MKRITLITLTFFVAITLISCKGKSEKAVAQNTQQEATGMAAAFMKSAEKSQAEEKAAEAEMPEQPGQLATCTHPPFPPETQWS